MNIEMENGVAIIHSDDILITDAQSALDLMAMVRYETGCDCIAIPKSTVTEDFFVLSTGIAGEILQKFVNYYCKLAVIPVIPACRSGISYMKATTAVIFSLR